MKFILSILILLVGVVLCFVGVNVSLSGHHLPGIIIASNGFICIIDGIILHGV